MQFLCSYKWPPALNYGLKLRWFLSLIVDLSTVFCSVARSLTGSEAGGDLVLNDADLIAFFV